MLEKSAIYRYENANPNGRNVDDCAIRAISIAENRTWHETYEKLSRLSNRQCMMIDSVEFIEDYLDKRYERIPHYSKTVGEFVEEFPEGTFLITMNGHITVAINGIVYDTFDCTNKVMRCAWEVI